MIWIRTNGIAHAFSRELGCTCGRCRRISLTLTPPPRGLRPFAGWDDPPWRAHTSASILVGQEGGAVEGHVLVDCGSGVVDSLVCSGLDGLDRLNALLLTHWHADHVLGLTQLCESLRRSAERAGREFRKLTVCCTRATAAWVRDKGGFAREFDDCLQLHEVHPEMPFTLRAGPVDITCTPLPVAHRDVEGAVIFVAAMQGKTVVFGWDIDVPSAALPGDTRTNQDVIDAHLRDGRPDILFVDANTWRARGTGHTSYEEARTYLDAINARAVYLTHVSGHEDEVGASGHGWSDREWSDAAGADGVRVARQGMILGL